MLWKPCHYAEILLSLDQRFIILTSYRTPPRKGVKATAKLSDVSITEVVRAILLGYILAVIAKDMTSIMPPFAPYNRESKCWFPVKLGGLGLVPTSLPEVRVRVSFLSP